MNVNFNKPPSVLDKDPYFNNVSLLMHMNGISGSKNFVDSSANNIQSTAVGNIEVSNARSQFGNGAAFLYGNGAGNYLAISGNPNLAVGTGDYTLEMWAYVNSDNPFAIYDSSPIGTPGSRPDSFLFYIEANRQPRFYGGGINIVPPINSFPINQWVYFALVRNTGITTIYVNGTGIVNSTGFYNDTLATGGCLIGTFVDNLNFTSNGYIDELRLTKGVARYTGNFIPPTTEFPDNSSQPKSLRFLKSNDGKKTLLRPVNLPITPVDPDPFINNVSLLLHMDGTNGSTNFIDSSINNFQFTVFGNAQISTAIKKFGNGAGYFNKTLSSSVKTSNNSLLSMGTQDFTVEAWIFPFDAGTDNNGTVIGGKNNNSFQIGYKSSTEFGVANSFSAWDLFSTTLPPINEWTHIAVTRSGNTMRIFYNGILITQGTNTTNYIGFTNEAGGYNEYGGYFNGYIDELRITKGIARYTSNFTPSTTAFPNP